MIRSLRADVWGDRRVHAARLVCLLAGHRYAAWSPAVDLVWDGAVLRQRVRPCLRCTRVEFENVTAAAEAGG